jgi:hypothetical protein
LFLIDLLGALLTVIVLGLLGLTGYLLALLALGDEARRDALSLAIATLLGATAAGVGLGLALGAVGLLRLELALPLLALSDLLLLHTARRRFRGFPAGDLAAPAAAVLVRARARAGESLALTLLAVHAVGSEAVRGLLRPPLSWDSLMYHLLLTAHWFQEENLAPFFGPKPLAFYGYVPANGSVWLWWWMAPSHSELYVNLAMLPQVLLLGLATGAVARALGAVRHWPAAAFTVLLLPTVVRFAATQYVDVFMAAGLVAALHFGLRWMARARPGDALLAGAGIGLAAGAKVLGAPFAFVLAAGVVAAARGSWGARLRHLLLALAVALPLGGYFYVRNMSLGVGPVAAECEGVGDLLAARGGKPGDAQTFPRPYSVLRQLDTFLERGTLADMFLGRTTAPVQELGVGPVAPLLLLAALFFPLGVWREGRERRRAAFVVQGQILLQLFFWLTIPAAPPGHGFANVRYLIAALAFALAGGFAAAERRGVGDVWIRGLAIALAAQGLLQLHAEMPRGVRLVAALVLLAAAALAFSPGLRAGLARRGRHLAVAALAVLAAMVLAAPFLAWFRTMDRARAFAQEYTTHWTPVAPFAGAWEWLDENAGDGTVAFVSFPRTQFAYPAMGLRLERRVVFVNLNRRNLRNAGAYPRCNPRVDYSLEAWLDNFAASGARWFLTSRRPSHPYAGETGWAESRPDLFVLRYEDANNRIYEYLPARPQAGR